jgi:hypothetical protein
MKQEASIATAEATTVMGLSQFLCEFPSNGGTVGSCHKSLKPHNSKALKLSE